MTTIRVRKRKNFVVIDKRTAQDKRLSWSARGLLQFLLSLPDDWEININHLTKCSPAGKHQVRTTINELKQFGYLTVNSQRADDGKFRGVEYDICEVPESAQSLDLSIFDQNSPQSENQITVDKDQINRDPKIRQRPISPKSDFPYADFPSAEKPASENQTLQSNNKQNTEYTKYKITNKAPADLEHEIAETLTPNQLSIIKHLANNELQQCYPKTSPDLIVQCLAAAVLDSKVLTKSGNNFLKKINTIKKLAREGQWLMALNQPGDEKKKLLVSEFAGEYQNLEIELRSLQRSIRICNPGNLDWNQSINKHAEAVKQQQQAILERAEEQGIKEMVIYELKHRREYQFRTIKRDNKVVKMNVDKFK